MANNLEEKVFYEHGKVKFVPNMNDGPQAYDIYIGKDHIYLPDRVLSDITGPGVDTERVERAFSAMDQGTTALILQQNDMTFKDLHILLLQLRVKEMEDQISYQTNHG